MSATETDKVHQDHQAATAEHGSWRAKIEVWKQENQSLIETTLELGDLLESHGAMLQRLLEEISEHELAEETHERYEETAEANPEVREWLRKAHAEYEAGHAARRKLVERLEHRQDVAVRLLGELRSLLLEDE